MGSSDKKRTCTIKIGSAVLAPNGRLRPDNIQRLAAEVAAAHARNVRIVLVSSGAVACGLTGMEFDRVPSRISDRQAAAAVGQPLLMRAWIDALAGYGITAAQVLLTSDDIDFRARFVNAHRTFETLLSAGIVPIVNENDSVTFEEIKLGDNDRLSALVSGLVGADLLLVLSTVEGLQEDGGAGSVIPEITDFDKAERHISDGQTEFGTGGMSTKIEAARIAREMGIPVIIASGIIPDSIGKALRGEPIGTQVNPENDGCSAPARRKQWIAHAIRTRGRIVVDAGAHRAVADAGASLLPKGIVAIENVGSEGFPIGSAVELATEEGVVFARGLVAYRSDEIDRIKGRPSDEIASVLGYTYCDEVVHRDDLIVTRSS